MKMRYCGSRNIILIWNIYLTILIPFVVLLSGIWHLESGVRNGKAAGLPIAVILAFLPLVLFGLNKSHKSWNPLNKRVPRLFLLLCY